MAIALMSHYPFYQVSKFDNLVEASLFDGPSPKAEEPKAPSSFKADPAPAHAKTASKILTRVDSDEVEDEDAGARRER